MNGEYKEIARFFVEQYNLVNGTHYEFECLRKSMFSNPKYRVPGFEIHQIAFIEGKKRSPLINNLMVMTRLQRRLITEVVKPRIRQKVVKNRTLSRLIEDIVNAIERDALNGASCSKYLLIDGRGFGKVRIGNPEIYKKPRLQRERLLQEFQARGERERSQASIPAKRWFKEIWFSCHDEGGTVRCLQMW